MRDLKELKKLNEQWEKRLIAEAKKRKQQKNTRIWGEHLKHKHEKRQHFYLTTCLQSWTLKEVTLFWPS